MKKCSFVFIFVLIFNLSIFQSSNFAHADVDCLKITPASPPSDKSYCEQQLNQIEAELTQLQAQEADQKKQTGTLKGDISYLDSQIAALQAKIKARSLAIAQLKVSINDKQTKIETLQEKIDNENRSLADLMRKTNEYDNMNIVEAVLSGGTISDFYSSLDSYLTLQGSIKQSVDLIKNDKADTESQKADLQKQQDAETDAKAELQTSQSQVKQSQDNEKQLLAVSQAKESAYEQLMSQKRAEADKIRSALFNLAGTSQKIEFGTALQYADEAQQKLGIDPAFLLAVITQESNLGANVGQCYLTNTQTGAGVGKNTGMQFPNVMKPMNTSGRKGDVDDFLRITSEFNMSWQSTAVSCPIGGSGWGGAMGPAQFIPTTWTLFEDRLVNLLGYNANPWQPRDAFMASAIYLTDLGAVGSSYSAQVRAACKYYGTGGSSCSYGKQVMSIKSGIQTNIDYLNQYGS